MEDLEIWYGLHGDCLALVPTHRLWEVAFEAIIERLDGMHHEGMDPDSVLPAFIRDVYAIRAVTHGGRAEHGEDCERLGLRWEFRGRESPFRTT